MEREGEDAAGQSFGHGQGALTPTPEERLLMKQVRVVDHRLDAARFQVRDQARAVGVTRDVQVEDVRAGLALRGRLDPSAGRSTRRGA